MVCLDLDILTFIKDNYKNYKYFIETGTYKGETILKMEDYFEKLITIEYSPELFFKNKFKYNGNKINFILGDSSQKLPLILPYINKPTIFFLDGHWSCGDTGRSNKDCPLIEEINAINQKFRNKAIIIIDDINDFGKKKKSGADWSDISEIEILKILEKRTMNYYYKGGLYYDKEKLIIHINKL